jgi:hypothetical protein
LNVTAEELDHELGHLASDEKWGWLAEPIDAELTRLRALLADAGAQFHNYAAQHSAKGTPDGDAKAATNTKWAIRCLTAAVPDNGV